jgi:hypothetical protein
MATVSIHIHADSGPGFSTSDPATVEAVRKAVAKIVTPPGYHASQLVGAHEMAAILKAAGRKHWAAVLGHMEEAHMVTVVFS